MKTRIALLLSLALTLGIAVNAQPRGERPDPAKMIEHRVAELDRALSLTPEQKTAITEIYTNQMEQRQAQAKAHNEQSPRMHGKDAKKRHHADMRETEEKVTALLTDEQRAKYQTYKQERRNDKGRHGDRPKGKHHRAKADAAKDCCKDKADCCKQAPAKTEKK